MDKFHSKLTKSSLERIKPRSMFAGGFVDTDTACFRWVAVKGAISDWTIYVGEFCDSEKKIAAEGAKVYDKKLVSLLVPCTKGALQRYRF